MSARSVPACLVKRGILGVTDNLQPGEVLNIGRAFINAFRPELEARLLKGGKKPCVTETKTSSPCRSGK